MVKLALLWHMHQPNYEDLATGEHILPWVRLHATKDYWGMAALLDEFPGVRVTFNLVPSLLVQVEAFASERAHDRHLVIGLKAAGLLTPDERAFLVSNGFHAPLQRAIRPNQRYAELYEKRQDPGAFTVQDLRDLQVWQKLVWMDPDWLRTDRRLTELVGRGSHFSEEDKQRLREVELELLRAVIPAYRHAATTGRVELTTSPFYHPILPLLCDTDVHLHAHPHSVLPRALFRHPDDAREQLTRAVRYHSQVFGARPAGVWPSEGSVDDGTIALLAEEGVEWTATDEEILARSLGRRLTAADLYRPYVVGPVERSVRVLFRDHELSDLIGFAYQSWDTDAAVADFIARVREAGRRFAAEGGGEVAHPVVTVILDGENAWEHYPGGGRPFLRALYRALDDAPDIETVTLREAAACEPRPLPTIYPGSWINGDFYIWAGHRDDHRAWAQLAAVRALFEQRKADVTPEARARAYEELLVAEGSDWFWWYGDDHSSDHDPEFDDLFRRHVRNVYRALGHRPPDELYLTNISTATPVAGPLALGVLSSPDITAPPTDFTQWVAAVDVPLGGGGGTMHRVAGQLVRGLRVASDLDRLYLRVEAPELVRRVSAGDARLAILLHREPAAQVEPDWVVAEVFTTALRYDRLDVRAGEIARLSLLVTDAHGHVLEQHPGEPFEVTVPTADHDAIRWLV